MKVLLLGATGLLGHNVLRRLMAEEHQVVALVRHADGIIIPTPPQGGWAIVEGSPLDYDTLRKASEGCDAIVNCAGCTDMSLRHYEDFLPVNRELCRQLAKLLDEKSISTLVHTSTVNTIGFGIRNLPADESLPMEPPFRGSYYADSKREGELLILNAAKEGRHVVIINPGFMLGPYDVKPSSGRMLLAAYRKPLMFAPKGGKAFVHVGDVAQAIVNALTHGENGNRYIAVNGHACISIKDLYEMQARVCGYRQKVFEVPGWLMLMVGKTGDMMRKMGVRTQVSTCNIKQLLVREYYSSNHAISDLGMPQTSIEVAIKDFYQWRKNRQ